MKFYRYGESVAVKRLRDAFGLDVAAVDDLQAMKDALEEEGADGLMLFVSFAALGEDMLDGLFLCSDIHRPPSVRVVVVLTQEERSEAGMISAMTRLRLFWHEPWDSVALPEDIQHLLVGAHQDRESARGPEQAGVGRQAATTIEVQAVGSEPSVDGGDTAGPGIAEERVSLRLDAVTRAEDAPDDELIQQMRSDLKSTLVRLRNVSPRVILGLPPGASESFVDQAYYRLLRDHHPDVHAHVNDGEVSRLAEEVFIEIRKLRQRALDERASTHPGLYPEPEDSSARVPASNAPTGPQRRHSTERMKAIAESARAMREERLVARARQEGQARAHRRQVTERLRKVRGSGDEPPMSVDQIHRTALAAVEAGSNDRALELFEQLDARKANVPGVSAWLSWLRWQDGALDDEQVIGDLDQLEAEYADDKRSNSVRLTLLGHVHRFGGQFLKAEGVYKEATRLDRNNEQAYRWWKYCSQRLEMKRATSRAEKEREGGLLSRLFGKR
ncbi:MAG: hypothetical protein EA398_09930 [Deltaproteobacteria bacterium]|nr:MAG: hypothetical protein EA398_09930 [Deltaproteobacteria bacterium]